MMKNSIDFMRFYKFIKKDGPQPDRFEKSEKMGPEPSFCKFFKKRWAAARSF